MSDKKHGKKNIPEFKTFPLANVEKRFHESNASIPDENGVKEAKDWVDYNKK